MIEDDETYLKQVTKDCKLIVKFDEKDVEFHIDMIE